MSNDQNPEDPKITRFPTAEERARAAAQQAERSIANDYVPPAPRTSEPILNLPPVVKTLCALLILIAVAMFFVGQDADAEYYVVMHFGFVPARYTGGMSFGWEAAIAPFTHMFLHGGFLHIAVNIGMLMAFGTALERAIGGTRLLVLYFLSGFAGVLMHLAFFPYEIAPLIGASGAISGVFGGMLMLMHREGMLGPGGYKRLALFAGLWIGISLLFGYTGMPGAGGNVAWTAHVGGFVAGLLLFNTVARGRKNVTLQQ